MSQHKKILNETLKAWIPLAAAIIILSLTAFSLVQQNYRMSANDPQIDGLESAIEKINEGAQIEAMLPPIGETEISKIHQPFAIAFDETGKVLGSTVNVDGQNPNFPLSALEKTKNGDQSRITWQPKKDAREAVVIAHYSQKDGKSGYVVVGRSLKETEARINQALLIAGLGCFVALLVSFLFTWFVKRSEHSTAEAIMTVETTTIIQERDQTKI